MASRKMTKELNTTNDTVTFTVGAHTLIVHLTDYSDATIRHLTLHGIAQKIGDQAAGVASEADILAAINTAHALLKDNIWGTTRKAGAAKVDKLALALATAADVTVEEASASLARLSKKQKMALRRRPEIITVLSELALAEADQNSTGSLSAFLI